ncbi:discoidin domain-containing protein [bacterium]|nr:discoidin domain-containing protein [bacterium]
MTSSSSQITTNKNASEFKPWETANQFMFKTVNNSVYLYSVSQAKYLKQDNTWQADASNASALTISTGTAQTNTLFFQIGSNYINANGEGNITISGWNTQDKGNNFTVKAWTEAELAELQTEYEAQQALKAQLRDYRTKAGNMAYSVYQRDALCTDASAYTSNFKESTEGSYEGLIDGNLNTYFHSAWSGETTADHYLQIHADMSAQDAVRFLFRKRYGNHVNRPTDILVQGSTDGENFEDITEITDGLPVTKDETTDPYYCSPALNVSGKNYQYIRFTVKATNNGANNYGHVFFTFSEFYLLPNNNVTAALSDIFTASWDDADLNDKIAAVDAVENEIVQFGNYKNISSYLPTADAYKNLIGEGVGHFSGDITEAYNNAKAAGEAAYNNSTDYTSLYNALTAAVNGLTINQPVNGKAYKLIAVYSDGKEQPLYWNGTRITAKNAENIADANTSVFVARVLESGKVVFVNNAGKYLSWCDSNNANKSLDVNGYTDRYIVQNDWTIEAATNTSNVADAAFAGLYQISALGKNGTDMYYLTPRYEGDNVDAAFISSGALDKWYDAPGGNNGNLRSYTFRLEEATYANTPVLNEAKGIDGINYIGTFSAPFATVVPAGVEAWYVSEKSATSATMTALTAGEAIPANEGVILTGAAAGAVTMLPVTSETVATISGNGLAASAGEAHTTVAGDYVMGLQNELVAFYPATVGTTLAMNKAYLNVGEGGGALAMNFGGNATGLNNAATTETENAPVFDLSGRRVMHTVKGGLYIQNGKKFIVK